MKHLKRYGIPLRQSGKTIKPNLTYGKRYTNKEEMQHKREAVAIAKMKELRAKGFSLGQIAEILDAMKIPTKTRKSKWDRSTIRRILIRNSGRE